MSDRGRVRRRTKAAVSGREGGKKRSSITEMLTGSRFRLFQKRVRIDDEDEETVG